MTAIVDWCTCTFVFDPATFPAFLRHLMFVTGYELQAVEPRALKGFRDGYVIHAWVKEEREYVPLAVMCWGGESQRGRAMLDIPGRSCGMIDWPAMRDFLEGLPESRLTRVDVAVDLHEGQFTVDDAMGWVREGLFNVGGRNPSTRIDGDWLPVLDGGMSHEGRTLYVGKTRNGKGLRVYEKGRQLGDADSEWNRFEVQFGNRDRVLPFEMLTEPTKYFVGAYPALERVVAEAGTLIETISNTAAITIGRILTWLKASGGKWLHTLASAVDSTDLVEELRVSAVPRRIQSSAVARGLLPGDVRLAFEEWRSCRGKK